MLDEISREASRHSATSGPNLLDRVSSTSTLSSDQILVDQLVDNSLSEATKGSTLLAMLGAGYAFRLTRLGTMGLPITEGHSLLTTLSRGASYAVALAGESATFAGIERGFHSSRTSFAKDWARAFISLGSIKLLGTAAQGQSLILQHLLTDLGMVGGQHLGAGLGLMEKPQGGLAQQMVQAEAMNWSMKGGMTLLHGLSPRLTAFDKSLDLYLSSRERRISPTEETLPFFPRLVPEGAPAEIGRRPDVQNAGPSREHIFLAKGVPTVASHTFPAPERVAEEIQSLHQRWRRGGGKFHIDAEGKEVPPDQVSLG